MSSFCGAHRVPRAARNPIDTPKAAIAVVEFAMRRPPVDETIVLVLDQDRRGRALITVDGTTDADAVVEVVERIGVSIVEAGEPSGMVVATIRPGGGPLPGDDERWIEASDVADDLGVELIEWFVVGGTTPSVWASSWCPRDLLGEVPRWSTW